MLAATQLHKRVISLKHGFLLPFLLARAKATPSNPLVSHVWSQIPTAAAERKPLHGSYMFMLSIDLAETNQCATQDTTVPNKPVCMITQAKVKTGNTSLKSMRTCVIADACSWSDIMCCNPNPEKKTNTTVSVQCGALTRESSAGRNRLIV